MKCCAANEIFASLSVCCQLLSAVFFCHNRESKKFVENVAQTFAKLKQRKFLEKVK